MRGRRNKVKATAVLLSLIMTVEMVAGNIGLSVQSYAQTAQQLPEVVEIGDDIQAVSQNTSEESEAEEAEAEASEEEVSKEELLEDVTVVKEQEIEEETADEKLDAAAEDLVVTSSSSLTLEENMTVNNLTINSGYLDLNNYELTVLGNARIDYGTLKVRGGELICQDFLLGRDGYLQMNDPNGEVTIKGNADFESEEENTLSAGKIRIAGDAIFNEKYDGRMVFSGTHKVILNGTEAQTVTFGSRRNLLNVLELQNTSDAGVVSNGAVMAREFILNDCKFSNSRVEGRTGWVLQGDYSTDGDLVLIGGTLDLNGHTLTVPGNFYQINGRVNINKGNLIVEKDYALDAQLNEKVEDPSFRSAATLCMIYPEDTVTVGKDFRMGTNIAHKDYLTNGKLQVKGNVINKSYQEENSFETSGSFRLVLNGESNQEVKIERTYWGKNCIANLEITNASGKVSFTEEAEPVVTGEYGDNGNASTGYVKLGKNATLYNNTTAGNVWLWESSTRVTSPWVIGGSFKQTENVTYDQNITIEGDLLVDNADVKLNGKTMLVKGDTYLGIENGSARVLPGGGRFECIGDVVCKKMNYYNYKTGFSMTNANDYVLIHGNYTTASCMSTDCTAGIMEIKGDFYQQGTDYGSFVASGTHKVILSGEKEQKVTFTQEDSRFATVELKNPAGIYAPNGIHADTIIWNGTQVRTDQEGECGYKLTGNKTILGDFRMVIGEMDLAGYDLTIEGDLIQSGGTMKINGGTLHVKGNYYLETAKKEDDKVTEESAGSGDLVMTNADDKVVVDGSFCMGTVAASSGKLTNGTLEVKGNFTRKNCSDAPSFVTSDAFRVVLGGTAEQVVEFVNEYREDNYIVNLEITNSSGKVSFKEDAEPVVTGEFKDNGNKTSGFVKLKKNATLYNNTTAGSVWLWEDSTRVTVPWVIGGSFKQTENVTYDQNITVEGDLLVDNSDVKLNGNTMLVKGDTYLGIDNGSARVLPGGGRFECIGDVVCKKMNYFSYETGFSMTNANDYVLIHGNYTTASCMSTDCTAGIMEIKGDFYQQGTDYGSFVASGTHKVILSGEKEQKVTFTQEESRFATVELKNPAGIYAPNGIHADTIIWNGTKVRTDQEGECGYKLTGNKTIQGDFLMVIGEMDLAGFDLTIEGDLIQSGGTMKINGGTLHVKGNYYLETAKKEDDKVTEESAGSGDLVMTNADDKVMVDGSFCMGTVAAGSGKLTNGTLEVKGNFTRKNCSKAPSFVTSDAFRVVLGGTAEQVVEFVNETGEDNYIANLEITNTSGKVSFKEDAEPIVTGEFKDNGNKTSGFVELKEGATLYNNTTAGNILLDSNLYDVTAPWVIGGDLKQLQAVNYKAAMTVGGDFFVSKSAFLNGNQMRVEGDVYVGMAKTGSALIVPEKGRFECGGNMVCETTASGNYDIGLSMKKAEDYVLVGKDFVIKSGYQGDYEAGTLEIKGDFIDANNRYAFKATGSHRVLMSGDKKQTVSFAMDSARCSVLELDNSSEEGVHFTMEYIPAAQFIPNDTNVSLPGNAKVGWTLEEDEVFEGELKLACGELNLNGHTLKVEGDVYVANGTINVNGGKLEVTGNLCYQGVTETGEGQEPVYGVSTGVLRMTNAKDHVLVHGDFVMQSTEAMSGLITAGTLELKGDFLRLTSKESAYQVSGEHRTLLSGNERQQVSLYYSNISNCFANLEVTNTSESGVYVASKVRVSGTLRDAGHKITSAKDCGLYLKSTDAIETECCGGTICLEKTSVMTKNLSVFGKLSTGTGTFDLNGMHLAASEFAADGQVKINGGSLTTDGNVTIGQSGSLVMTDVADSVVTGNQFTMNSRYDHTDLLTAGVLEVKGNFEQKGTNAKNFAADGTHMTILSGKSGRANKDYIQTITFNNPGSSKFKILKLTKKLDKYVFIPSNAELYEELIHEIKDEAPAQVENIRVGNKTTSTVELLWDTPYDDEGVVGYEIYNGETKVAVTALNRFTIDGLKPGQTYTYIIYAYDKAGNYSPASEPFGVTTQEDTTPPDAPTGLKIKTRTGSAVTLTWNASSDDVGVTGYKVYRDNVPLAEIAGVTLYRDDSVVEDEFYTYAVTAVDAAGNESEKSQAINASAMMPEILRMTPEENDRIGGEKTTLKVYYRNVGNSVGNRVKFEYRISGSEEWNAIGEGFCEQKVNNATEFYSETAWNLAGLKEAEYKVRVSVYDADNNVDTKEYAYYLDAEGPMAPTNLLVTSKNGIVTVAWAKSGSKDCVKYNVYRSVGNENAYKLLTTTTENSCIDKNVEKDETYYYKISGIDDFGHEGECSEPASVLVEIDTERPLIKSIKASEGQRINGVANIAVSATDNVGVGKIALSYYDSVKDSWVSVGEEQSADNGVAQFVLDTTKLANAVYTFRALATDINGNKSLQDEDGEYTTQIEIDNQGIEKIVIVEAKGYETHVTLKWNDVADDDISHFVVEKQGMDGQFVPVKTVTSTLGAHIENLPANETFVFRVVGYDTLGNRGTESDEVNVSTSMDVSAPIIRSFYPAQKEFSQVIPLSIGVTDNVGVKSLKLSYSVNKEEWIELAELVAENTPKEYTFEYDFDVTDMAEGTLYVRAYAYDEKNNESNYEGQPIENSFIVDRTPPSKVADLTAEGKDGHIALSWAEMDSEEHIQGFSVYRAKEDSQMFELLADNVRLYYYDDVSASKGVAYSYKVCAQDMAGNVGQFSDVVVGQCSTDSEKPVVHAVSPEAGSTLAGEVLIRTIVTDNAAVDEITFEYKEADQEDEIWTRIGVVKEEEAEEYPSVVWDVTALESAVYKLRITATDMEGNISEPYEVEYVVDSEAPQAPVLVGKAGGYSASLSWNENEEEDFKQYEILRKRGGEENYKAIKTLTETSYADKDLLGGKNYMYKVRAYDNAGNYAESNVVTVVPTTVDTTPPVIITSDTYSVCVGDEVWLDASQSYDNVGITQFKWEMGNGDVKYGARTKYVYGQIGEYDVTLTVSDAAGNLSRKTVVVKVRSKEKAKLTFSIRSQSESNTLLSYSYIAVENSAGEIENYTTDIDAKLTLTLNAGTYKISAYKEGYLPKVLEVTVSDGDVESMVLSLEKGEIVTGELTQRRLSFKELEELGVDPQDPNNWYQYTYSVTYIIKGIPMQVDYEFPVQQEPIKITWIDGEDAFAKIVDCGPTKVVVIYKVMKQQKEMYDVTLFVTNHAEAGYGFDIIDSTAELILPEGLSLIDLPEPQSLVNDLGILAAQETKETHWYIKADRTGSYELSAEFDGLLLPFEVPVEAMIYSDEPIEVEYISGADECEVTFDFDMEDVEDLKRYTTRGNYIVFPNDPVKPGYTFVGWYYGDSRFEQKNPVRGDMLLVARYVKNSAEDDQEPEDDVEEPKPGSGNEEPKPGAGNEEPKPGSGNEEPKPGSGNNDPKPGSGNGENDPTGDDEDVKEQILQKKVPKKNYKKQISGITYRVTKSHKTRGTVEVYKVKEDKKTVKIPDKVKIDGYSFKVTSIYKKAFKNNKKVQKVTIKDNVTSIGTQAFYGCKNLKTVTVGKGLKSIGAKAFYNCKSLKKITISSKKLNSVGKYALKGIHKDAKIYVPSSKVKAYKKVFKKKGQKSSVQIKKK